ncbi:hypothetical protein BDD12DRAFT_977719 [Trichophaea hybrida]|nr:hypothetical protein BDD12DRAFT_977719 [Trichophaea hybrida]
MDVNKYLHKGLVDTKSIDKIPYAENIKKFADPSSIGLTKSELTIWANNHRIKRCTFSTRHSRGFRELLRRNERASDEPRSTDRGGVKFFVSIFNGSWILLYGSFFLEPLH